MSEIPTMYSVPFRARTLYSEENDLCYVNVEYSFTSPITGVEHRVSNGITVFEGTKEEFAAKFHADIEVEAAIMEKFDLQSGGEGNIKKILRKEYDEAVEAAKNPFEKARDRVDKFDRYFTAVIDLNKF